MSPVPAARSAPARWLAPALVLALAAAGAGCAADGDATRALGGLVSDPPLSVAGLSLPDAADGGTDYTLTPDAGELLVVYFGYTACPDVCPTTLHEVEVALRELGDLAARVEVAMVTIDPARDEPVLLTDYVRHFVPDGHALRTTDDERLRAVATAFGASYSVEPTADGGIDVGHTPNLYVVDESGDVVLTWPFGLTSESIATDLEILLETA
jgi:protein SCO1/2